MNFSTVHKDLNDILNTSMPKKSSAAKFFHTFITILVIIDIGMIIMLSTPGAGFIWPIYVLVSVISVFVFSSEYLLRIITAKAYYNMKSHIKAAARYIVSFWGVIDFACILPFVLPYLTGAKNSDVIDLINFGRVLLIFKLIRYSRAFTIIKDTFISVKSELFVGYFIALVVVTISGVLMYYIERGAQPEKFIDMGEGLWWAIITFATVGYGDIYPITPMGKILASVIAFIGIGMIALPSGIISSAFMRRVNSMKDVGGNILVSDKPDSLSHAVRTHKTAGTIKKCPHCGHPLDDHKEADNEGVKESPEKKQ